MVFIWFFLVGIYLTLASYHFMIFLGRKEDKKNLYYTILLFSFIYLILFKIIIPYFNTNYQIFSYRLQKTLIIFSPDFCIIGIVLFTSNIFRLKKIKMISYIGYFFFVILVSFLSISIFLYTNNYRIAQMLSAIFKGSYGIIYWILLNIIFFDKKNKMYKERWLINIYISINFFYVFFMTYPLLVIIGLSDSYQLLYANIGLVSMAFLSAYALTTQFNKEHKDLKELTNTLEQKVLDRTKDLQKAKDQIEQKEKQKSIAFTNIFHEIKTPLTLISNYIEKHIKNYGLTEEIKITRENIDKLKRDILNALDFEKLDRGMVFYDHSQIIDISEIVKMNILMYKELAYSKNIIIKHDIQDYIYSKIDKNSIDRIINNLLDNAVKYTCSNGKIDITLKADNKDIELIIKDTGIGISKEEQKKIFKPYYQISHNKRNIQGIGMGLNIVKMIIDKVKGNIKIESKKDKGTVFKIKLKRYYLKDNDRVEFISKNKKSTIDIMSIKLKEPKYKKDRHNIFVVEDNIQMLSYLQESLFDKYNFYYAVNGKDALEKIKRIKKPDLIISDIMMDEMDGYEFYEKLLKLDDYRLIPFIFLTAKSGKYHRLEGLQKGAIDYIEKPFDISELLVKINSIIRITKALEDGRIKDIQNKLSEYIKGIVNNNKNKDVLLYKYKISGKESEIISLVLEGLEYKEIAYQLKISLNTVKTHIKHIFNKCQINNKAELINIFN